jgi:5-methyltetrahydrofolate--homocysteine methyltransferase
MASNNIEKILGRGKLMVLDGAMGTMIQSYHLTEDDFRGERFKDIPGQMQGNNDILVLTRPDVIKDIHRRYLEAGADIITANTFSSQRISMADYHCEHLVQELNREAVRIAREAVQEYISENPDRECCVIATVGPTNKTLSMSPDVSDPSYRAISYDDMFDAYIEQMQVLFDCNVDAVLLETIFDTLYCKAGIHAYQIVREKCGKDIPLMLSVTVSDKAGRLLSGQTLEAFLASVQHAPILSVGLNCSFGAEDMISCLRVLAEKAP